MNWSLLLAADLLPADLLLVTANLARPLGLMMLKDVKAALEL